jgi:integrase
MANSYGVRRRGKKWTACPYIPGQGKHVWAGTHDSQEDATKAAIAKIEELRILPPNLETVQTFAERDGLVLSNPFSELRISKGRGRKDIVPIDAEELGTLCELALSAHGKEFGRVFRSILRFAAYTGLRPGELFGLDWDDIDFEAETVHVRRQFHKRRVTLPKSNERRSVFLPAPAAQALRDLPARVPKPLCHYSETAMVFPGKLDQRITASACSGYWAPVRTAFGATLSESRRMDFQRVDGSLDFYAVTRHFCATYLIEQGVESWIVARQLGHQDGGRLVESVYGHPRDEIARERLRRVFKENVQPLRPVKSEEATG